MVATSVLAMAALAVLVIVLVALVIVPPRAVFVTLRAFERRTGTPPLAMLAAVTVSLLVFTLAIAGGSIGDGEFGLVDGLLAVGGMLGPPGVAVGLAGRTSAQRIDAATDCRTGDPETGRVAVDGALQSVDGTFDAPDTENVLACAYALQTDRGFASSSSAWITVEAGQHARPLAVDDGSGAVRVDEDAVAIRSGRRSQARQTIELPEDEKVPDDVSAFLSTVGADLSDPPERDHRLRIRPLTTGETVTAVGEYDRITKPGDAFWGISDGEGAGYLFPGDLDSVRSLLARRSRWLTGGGAVLTLVGVGYVASLFIL